MKPPKFPIETWKNVNWELPAKEIASHLGCRVQLVYEWAKRLGIELPKQQRGQASRIEPSEVDWSKSTSELAEEYGVTPQWMGALKRRYFATKERN